ncbi:MAG TPA: DUF4260 domain-containing protein [Anaerolineales bacterium]|jgi:hypothetical protein
MRNLIKIEEFALLGLAVFLFAGLDYAWWSYPLLFFAPDVSMVGYAAGSRIGAAAYNLVHHKGVAVACYVLGSVLGQQGLQFAGLIILGHSSFDRIWGYGLKYPDSFQNTHLGRIGRQSA